MNYLKLFFDIQRAVLWANNRAPESYTNLPHGHVTLLRGRGHDIHPSVAHLLKAGHRPHDMHLLVLECPHPATKPSNAGKIAYVRNEREGMKDVQAVSSVGKYLHRHWPTLPDHMIRDAAALGEPGQLRILDTMEGIICGVEFGPQSCMKSSYGSIPFGKDDDDDVNMLVGWARGEEPDANVPWYRHPYSVYQPAYGWKMAVITIPKGLGEYGSSVETYQARALVLETTKHKCFVRTYQRPVTAGSFSEASHRLEALLTEAGYTKRDSWPSGTMLAKVDHPDDRWASFMAPYIDGSERGVSDHGDHLCIAHNGYEYMCDNTDGTPGDKQEDLRTCDDCSYEAHEESDTWSWVGIHEDHCVCESCADHYVDVMRSSPSGRGYRVFRENTENYQVAEIVDSCGDYTETYLWTSQPPDGYIETQEGWCHENDAVLVTNGDWYPRDYSSRRITVVELERECPDTGASYALEEDAVEIDGKWYSNEDDVSALQVETEIL